MMAGSAEVFEQHRAYLRGLGYRMTGSLADSEDLLQEAFLRWQQVAEPIENARAYLARLMTNLCLDWLKSARVLRESYVGTWLPEPVLDEEAVMPDASSELAQDISVALMLTLERLSPLERAAFLLHDVFDVDYADVAETLAKSEDACRQLAARARAHLQDARPRRRPSDREAERVLMAFGQARLGDISELRAVLAEDCVFYTDGGGRVPSATVPIRGRDNIVHFLDSVMKKFYPLTVAGTDAPNPNAPTWRPAWINGMPGVVGTVRGTVMQTLAFDIQDGQVKAAYAVRNPEKLTRVGAFH
jgi:RNA polymerase sigma-70 factor (ECF subfamily)